MKKVVLVISLIFCSYILFAQNHFEKLTSNLSYKATLGLGIKYSNTPFDKGKIGLHLGIDALKPLKSFYNNKVDLYGTLGLHFVQKGGKQGTDLESMLEEGNSFKVSQFSVPIHGGITYNFNKCKLFLDLGPYFAFGIGGSSFEGLKRKSIDLGIGINWGIQFKKFGLGFGVDKGFTNIAEYEVLDDNNSTGDLAEGDKFKLKGKAIYINLSWILGKKKHSK